MPLVYRKLASSVKLTPLISLRKRNNKRENDKKCTGEKNGLYSYICIRLTEKERKPYRAMS